MVFKPGEAKNLELALKSNINKHHLLHYIKVRDNKEKIREQYKKLKRNKENRIAINRTIQYLPQRRVKKYPPVSFVIFESNGRGSSPIVVDLAASIEWDFVSFLAHEYHHWYRARQLQFNYSKVTADEIDIVNALSLIEAEGIADMVDKKDWYTKPNSAISDYAKRFIQDVGRTSSIIYYIDQALVQISKNPYQKSEVGKRILNVLPQRGHTTGYFMARLILEKFNKNELVKCVGNPFKFLILYDKAAKLTGNKYPGFSIESINIIQKMMGKYKLY